MTLAKRVCVCGHMETKHGYNTCDLCDCDKWHTIALVDETHTSTLRCYTGGVERSVGLMERNDERS